MKKITCLLMLWLCACSNPDLKTVAQVDVQRYSGQWYEIARLPMPFQNQCAAQVTAHYTVNADNSITVRNRCQRADGSWSEAEGLAWADNPENNRLRVSFLPQALRWLPFGRAPYWIMALDQDYQNAMIGQPQRQYLWLLSRTPHMKQEIYHAYLKQAEAEGYDLKDLIQTQQEKRF